LIFHLVFPPLPCLAWFLINLVYDGFYVRQLHFLEGIYTFPNFPKGFREMLAGIGFEGNCFSRKLAESGMNATRKVG
jgi:hypothetical protein